MFVGHFAPALVAASHKDAPSLPVLFVAAQLIDWVFFGFVLVGIEQFRLTPGFTQVSSLDLYYMPYTHSLIGAVAFALAFGILVSVATKNRTAALIAVAVVLSHWFLDLLVHVPDLTIAGQPPKLGLGLWDHAAIEMPLEIAMTLGALWFYATQRGGLRMPVLVLGGVLLLLQAVDWFGAKPVAVDVPMILLGWLGYAVATLAAWWAARQQRVVPAAPRN
jgi:hypothetical protein